MRKILYLRLLLSVVCILSGIYLNAQETVFTGSCGATQNDNLTWTLDTQSNTLTIAGSGAMMDYDNETNKAPWLAYSDDDLEILKLGEGITHIGDYAFYSRTYLTSFRLPFTLQSVGDYAFARCFTVMYVEALAETAPSVGVNAFQDCGNGNEKLYYNYYDEDQYTYGYWAMYFKNVAPIYVDKVGDNIISIVNPHTSIINPPGTGLHEINGTGAMYDYDNSSNPAPYRTWTAQYPCAQLKIEEGITHIGDYAFYGYDESWITTSNYTSYSTPLSVETIGDYAFYQCFPENSDVTLLTTDHKVTHIGDGAFSSCGGQFSFPETLVHIGEEAFSYGYLTSLSLPENLEYIGDRAFTGNYNLTGDITIPDNVTYLGMQAFGDCYQINGHVTLSANLDTIREQTFNMCAGIISVTIPEGITAIEELAFNYCSSMTGDLTIPNSVTYIGQSAFANCASLDGTLTLPENLTEIKNNVFYDCKFTGALVIPENVTSIGNSAFQNNRFTGDLNIPEGVTSIGYDAFYGCTFDGTLNIPNSLTSISSAAFSGCDFTGTLNIHENVTSIGEYAFSECTNITELVLERGLTGIDSYAFQNCSSLNKVTSLAIAAPTLGTDVFTGINPNATLYYPEAGQQSYTDNGWLQYFSNSNNQMCGDFAFYEIDLATGKLTITGSGAMWDYDGTTQAPWRQYATQITSVEIHDGITAIGDNAFYGMSALTGTVTIPESVTLIGESAFQGCTGINELTIYDGLTEIANNAFFLNVALNKVTTFATTAPTLGSNVFTNISADAVLYCPEEAEASYIEKGWDQYFTINAAPIYGGKCGDNITWTLNLTTGELVVTGTGAMWDWDYDDTNNPAPWYEYIRSIKSLTLSEGITHIGECAFRDLGWVENPLVLPTTLISIGDWAFIFFGNNEVGTLELPQNLVSIGSNAFNGTEFTGTLNIPNSVTTLGASTFMNCHFSEVNISENITKIPVGCFGINNNLTTVNIPAGITEITDGFQDCPAIETVTVLATVAPILNVTFAPVFSPEIYETATLYYHADATDYEEKGWFDYFSNRYAVYTGTCGEDAYWTLNVTTGELRIYGTGAMDNYHVYQNGSYIEAPWYNYSDLITSVVVEEGITNVGSYTFYYYYTNLTSLTLANTVTSIGNHAFRGAGLTGTINIPASVTSIGNSAFRSCTGITALNIAGSASIGEYTFADCTGITKLNITRSASIGNYAFQGCSGLQKFNPYYITSIGNYAFQNCTGLTEVYIPASVTSIGNYAFSGCSELNLLSFSNNGPELVSIGEYAFEGLSKLVGSGLGSTYALRFPTSVTTIGAYAFANCVSIPELTFTLYSDEESELTTIGSNAFYNCTSLESVDLSKTKLTTIGSYAFQGCSLNNERFSMPSTLKIIESYAFEGTGLSSITFPESLETIGRSAFANCTNLRQVDLSHTNVSKIWDYAFANCYIYNLYLPVNSQYTTIESHVFENNRMTELIIPNNVNTIYGNAFDGCTRLTRVILPSAIAAINSYSFNNCNNITEVYATGTCSNAQELANVLKYDAFSVNISGEGSAILYIPEGSKDCYTYTSGSDSQWIKQFPTIIEGDIFSGQCGDNAYYVGLNINHSSSNISVDKGEVIITGRGTIYNYDRTDNPAPWLHSEHFYNGYGLTELTISPAITSIGDYAFYGCEVQTIYENSGPFDYVGRYSFANSDLYSIIADSIGAGAFSGCKSLSVDDVVTSASYIGDRAFYNSRHHDNGSEELFLERAYYIGDSAFYNCEGFTGGVTINKAVHIGDYAFYTCDDFAGELSISNTVTNIGKYAFAGTNFTGSLILPDSLTTLGEYAFYNCDNFNGTLALPETLETINNYTFYGCSGFTGELVIPNIIISINDRAFSACSGFTGTLVIPENVTTIGSNAFSNCYGFTALELNDNITTIGSSAFHYCNGMTGELVLPNRLANINNSAFNSVPFTDVVTFRTQPATLGTSVFNAITGSVYVPYQYQDTYLNATNWSAYSAKTVGMPTYVELSGGVKYWNGISSGIEPLATDRVALDATLDIEDGSTLTVESFGYCGLDDETFGHLTVKDGGQLFHNKAYNPATLEKEIIGYAGQQSTDNGQQTSWYTISSPLNEEIDLSTPNSSFLTPNSDYDLYRYDEPTYTWQNSKPGDGSTNFQNIEPGRGYLFASAEDATLQFNGHLNTDAVTYNLTAQGEKLTGFHLIGNPFAHDIYFDESIITPEKQTIVFELYDATSNGWMDAGIIVSFSDGSESEFITFVNPSNSGMEFHKLEISAGVDVTITWKQSPQSGEHGFWISYDDGEVISSDYGGYYILNELEGDEIELFSFTVKGVEQAVVNGYYTLTGEGAWAAEASTTEAIKPGQGILVKSLVDNYELAISDELSAVSRQQSAVSGQRSESVSMLALSVNNGKHSDRAFVVFNEGAGLDKINHENENIPLLYIPMEDADYAIAMMDENVNEIPVNFETNVMGQYTISLRQENCNLEGIYLLDKETGNKVNILEEDYTFMAMSGDNAERFVLAKDNGQQTTDNGHFAYINNGDIVIFDIEGDAQIRIVDALGRCVYNGEAADETNRISANVFANGVYVIEKIDDKGINVQKIIL